MAMRGKIEYKRNKDLGSKKIVEEDENERWNMWRKVGNKKNLDKK